MTISNDTAVSATKTEHVLLHLGLEDRFQHIGFYGMRMDKTTTALIDTVSVNMSISLRRLERDPEGEPYITITGSGFVIRNDGSQGSIRRNFPMEASDLPDDLRRVIVNRLSWLGGATMAYGDLPVMPEDSSDSE